jgi:uncharacterized cofD-like protein
MTSFRVEPDVLAQVLDPHEAGPRVVAIGGGTGLAQALQAITHYAGAVTAIVTVADDGGSSGRLVPALDIPPPGDIRRCLVALTPQDSVWRRLFEYRFETGDIAGHSLGNLILAAMADLEDDFEEALRTARRLLGAVGDVVPASPGPLRLEGVVAGEPKHGQVEVARAHGRVERLWLEPETASASPSALEAVMAADQIVLGPGSLYTSVAAALLVPGIVDAVNASRARLVVVANIMTQDAETLGMDAADHLDGLLDLTGVRPPGAIVANVAKVDAVPPLETLHVDPEIMATYGADVIEADLVDPTAAWPRHDPARLGDVLSRLATA